MRNAGTGLDEKDMNRWNRGKFDLALNLPGLIAGFCIRLAAW